MSAIRPNVRKAIMQRDSNTCGYCGGEATTVDHIIPLSRGGSNLKDNLVASCRSCNHIKGGRVYAYVIRRINGTTRITLLEEVKHRKPRAMLG